MRSKINFCWPLFTIWLVLVFLQTGLLKAQQKSTSDKLDSLKAELQTALDKVVKDESMPGATLAVCLPDGSLISLASGFADVEANSPMPSDGQMMVGSTGKTYVSAVALQLVSEGKLDLDDNIKQHFADSDRDWYSRLPNADALTIRSLMNHTSGLPRYVFASTFLEDVKKNPLKARSPRECLSVILDADPNHAVGEGWGYSDTNYMLLGLIIEKVTGNSYYDEAQRRLMDPLKLKRTVRTTQAKLPGLTQGYIGENNPFGLPKKTVANQSYAINPSFEWCGGGYMADVGDLARWMQALHGGKVLKSEVYSQLIQPVDFRTGKPAKQGYGLGTFVWQTEIGEFVGHAGMMPGYLTQIEFSRKNGFAVAFQMNSDQGSNRKNHNIVVGFAKIVNEHMNDVP